MSSFSLISQAKSMKLVGDRRRSATPSVATVHNCHLVALCVKFCVTSLSNHLIYSLLLAEDDKKNTARHVVVGLATM